MKQLLNAHDIIVEILKEIIAPGDFFNIWEHGTNFGGVSYSRSFCGGAYQGAVRYRLVDEDRLIFVLDAIHKPSRMIREEFDLANPDSFKIMGNKIRELIDTMQTNRHPHGTDCRIAISDRYGKWKKSEQINQTS